MIKTVLIVDDSKIARKSMKKVQLKDALETFNRQRKNRTHTK